MLWRVYHHVNQNKFQHERLTPAGWISADPNDVPPGTEYIDLRYAGEFRAYPFVCW